MKAAATPYGQLDPFSVEETQFRGLGAKDKRLLAVWAVCVAVAVALPYPATKIGVAVVLGLAYVTASLAQFHLALSGFILLLPFLDTAYHGSLLFPGMNLQTLFVVYLVVVAANHKTDVNRTQNRASKPLLALIVLMVVSAMFVAAGNGGLVDLLMRIKNSFAYSLLMVLGFSLVRDPRHKLMIVTCVFIAVLLNVLYSLREVSLTLALSLSFMRHRAVSLIALQPNLYAGFLSLYLFFFIAFLMYYPTQRRYKVLLFGATCLVVMNLVYTMSRGAWLACIVTGVYAAITSGRRLIFPIALLATFVYFWAPEMATERWDSSFEGPYDVTRLVGEEQSAEAEEAATRIVQWRSFLPMLAEHPIVGVGYGQYDDFFKSGGYFPTAKSPHSSFIEIGIELGVGGLTLYLLTLGTIIRGASRVFKTAAVPIDRGLGLGLLTATICLLLLDLSGTRFRNGDIMAYYWILAGITLNALQDTDRTRSFPMAGA